MTASKHITDITTDDRLGPDNPPICCGLTMKFGPYGAYCGVWTCWKYDDTQIHVDQYGRVTEPPFDQCSDQF
jgi:hypothetical protein